jgi:hypothetical protein
MEGLMKKNLKLAFIGLMGLGFAASLQTEAFAWGCVAGARDGASGWSTNYPNRGSAVRRALAECNARTYYRCRIRYCNPNG